VEIIKNHQVMAREQQSTALDFLIQSNGFQVRDAGIYIAKPLYQKLLCVDLPVNKKSKKSKQSKNPKEIRPLPLLLPDAGNRKVQSVGPTENVKVAEPFPVKPKGMHWRT